MPAQAGSLLAWNQAILHWGGRASRRAQGPRTSVAFEFQRGDTPPLQRAAAGSRSVPPFTERLGLIGKQVLQYQHMYPLTPDVERLAIELRDGFMPRIASGHQPSNNRLPEQPPPEPGKPRLIDPKPSREPMTRRSSRAGRWPPGTSTPLFRAWSTST